jgi:hypothetical protein
MENLSSLVESTYASIAAYFHNKGNKAKAGTYIDKGLKYVPESRLLRSLSNL